jgi:hypothetical protein
MKPHKNRIAKRRREFVFLLTRKIDKTQFWITRLCCGSFEICLCRYKGVSSSIIYIVTCRGVRIIMVLDRWLDLLALLCTIYLNYKPHRAIADLHIFQFTAAHVLGSSVSTNRCLVADLNRGTITSNHYEVFLSFLLQSPWNANPILQVQFSSLCTAYY